MIPGDELDKVIAVARELNEPSMNDLTDELAIYFGESRAREIITELSEDRVFAWYDSRTQSYLARVSECVWCHWWPMDHSWSHEFNWQHFSDGRPHHYDYRVPTTP